MVLNLAAALPISHTAWAQSMNQQLSMLAVSIQPCKTQMCWTILGCRSRTNRCAASLIGNSTGNEGEGKSRRIHGIALLSLLPADTRTSSVQCKAAGNVLNWALILTAPFCSFRSQLISVLMRANTRYQSIVINLILSSKVKVTQAAALVSSVFVLSPLLDLFTVSSWESYSFPDMCWNKSRDIWSNSAQALTDRVLGEIQTIVLCLW